MRNNALKNALSLLLTAFLITMAFSAHAFKLNYDFDLIQFDYPDVLEPGGDGKITVEFSDDLLDAYGKDPYSLQYIVDAAKPIVDKYAVNIKQLGKELQEKISEVKAMEKDGKTLSTTVVNWKGVLKEKNKHYQELVQKAKKEAEAAMQDQWVKLVATSEDLKKFKIKIGITVAKGVFEIVKGVISAVGTMGAEPTAYVGIVKGIILVYGAVSDALKTEEEARKALKTAIDKAEKSLDKFNQDKLTILQLFDKWYTGKDKKGEELRAKIDIFHPKLIKSRLQAQDLAKALQVMLDGKALEDAKAPDGKGKVLEGKALEDTIAAQLNSITELGTLVASGEALIKEAEGLISVLEGTRTNKTSPEKLGAAMKQGKEALEGYDANVAKAEKALSTGEKLLQAFVSSVK